ncbi:MAG: hypothetical protein Q7U97_01790 [Rhodocyclaceae bacterium]|nr:hypothetical protein [Rhodocyclaceae bacterium]
MKLIHTSLIARFILIGIACSGSLVFAQTSGATTNTDTSTTRTPTPATAANPTSKLVGSFTDLAGSKENASSLVNGLRTGSVITLTDTTLQTGSTTSGMLTTSTTFSPGTKPMGYGNIRIALSLARAQLASQGITNPTPEQLQGALVGTSGTGTATQGILQMRASGMGWGQIANSLGLKLGAVMSGKQTLATTSTTATSGTASRQSSGGVATASGTTASDNSTHAKSGIATATGGMSSGKSVTTGLGIGAGHASASGTVNAAGGKAGGVAVSNAGGQGRGKP